MTELPVQRLLLDAIAAIDGLGIPYAVMGGFAVRVWGVPRPTYDADLAVAADAETLLRLLAALEEAGFDVPDAYRKGFLDTVARFQKVKVTRFSEGSVWDVDLFLARGAFFDAALPRRRRQVIEGQPVQVLAPEDIVALKLLAFRRKDQLDIEEIVAITQDLDLDHLRAQARRLGVEHRVGEFLPEGG